MEINFWDALFLFLSGAIAHAFAIRIMGIYSKIRIYRLTLVNCLSIIKFASNHAELFLKRTMTSAREEENISSAIKFWKDLSIVSLKNATPKEIWQSLGVKDWRDAEKLIKKIENLRGENE